VIISETLIKEQPKEGDEAKIENEIVNDIGTVTV